MLLNSRIIDKVKERFSALKERVRLIVFTQEFECQFCQENRTLNEEIASVSDKIDVEVFDFQKNRIEVERYRISQIPATVVMGERDYGLRFYGIPGGYEFNSLLDTIVMVSQRESGLSAESKRRIKGWNKPTRIQVMVTLTCPYCPQVVRTAHQLAFENEFITAEMVDITEFPHLVSKYQVYGVPKVVINEKVQFEGALPEEAFIDRLLEV
ncbi:MAG: thioredoxin family protein [bacterium]|nr:thioredoxin family protein [bacterium]